MRPTSEDLADRLRFLATEYSQGRLTLEAYRKVRSRLLDSLTGSSEPPAPNKLPVPPAAPQAPHLLPAWLLGLGLAVLGTLVVAAYSSRLFRDRNHERYRAQATSRGQTVSDSPHTASPGSGRIFELVSPLLDDPVWTEARIAAVNAALLEEGPRRIAAQRRTQWFRRFAQEVQRRLEEQQALEAGRAVPERSSLAALAETIGLDVESANRSPKHTVGRSR